MASKSAKWSRAKNAKNSAKLAKESEITEEALERSIQLQLDVIDAFNTALFPLGMKPSLPPQPEPTIQAPATKVDKKDATQGNRKAGQVRSQSQQQARRKDEVASASVRHTKSSLAVRKPSIHMTESGYNESSQDGVGAAQDSALPRKLSSRRRRRRAASSAYSFESSEVDQEEEEPPKPKPAWDQFTEHIKTFNSTTSFTSTDQPEVVKTMDNLLNKSGSEICKKILKDLKEQVERRKAKELAALQKALEAEAAAKAGEQVEDIEDDESEEESEDEEEIEKRRRKEEAQRYWGIIRRDVQEKIRIRKEKNPAGGTWNALRSQLRAMTRADNVRKELYEKYGIIPKDGCRVPEDSMKPKLSIDVKDVVNRFNSYQIRKLRVTFS